MTRRRRNEPIRIGTEWDWVVVLLLGAGLVAATIYAAQAVWG